MNEFTPEWIAGEREIINNVLRHKDSNSVEVLLATSLSAALDEITRLNARVQELEAEKTTLQDPIIVRAKILSNQIVVPNDLVWLYDTHGKVAELHNKIVELEIALKNKCSTCGLAISHGIWGDEDNVYDDLPQPPKEE